jgi:hypothetical protein
MEYEKDHTSPTGNFNSVGNDKKDLWDRWWDTHIIRDI